LFKKCILFKKCVFLLLCAALLFSFSSLTSAEGISIIVNGDYISSDVQPLVKDGTTYIPLRAVGEALNVRVGWCDAERTAIIRSNDYKPGLMNDLPEHMIEGLSLEVNGKIIRTSSILLENHRILAPLRLISENLGAAVSWDNRTKTIYIVLDADEETNKNLIILDKRAAEILSKSWRKMLEVPSYSTKMHGNITLDIAYDKDFQMDWLTAEELSELLEELNSMFGDEDDIKIEMLMDSEVYYRKSKEIYLKMKMDMGDMPYNLLPAAEGLEPGKELTTEIYLSEEGSYYKINNDKWTSIKLSVMDISQYNPKTYVDLMNTFKNIAKYSKLEKIENKPYHVIEFTIDKERLLDMIRDIIPTFGMDSAIGIDYAELSNEELLEAFGALEIKYLYYIDRNDLTLHKVVASINTETEMMYMKIDMAASMEMTCNFTDVGKMPKI